MLVIKVTEASQVLIKLYNMLPLATSKRLSQVHLLQDSYLVHWQSNLLSLFNLYFFIVLLLFEMLQDSISLNIKENGHAEGGCERKTEELEVITYIRKLIKYTERIQKYKEP